MNEAFLLIGGNMGDREQWLEKARQAIAKNSGELVRQSSLYETAAWGKEDQPAFLNQALLVRTALDAEELLRSLLSIEEELGRRRQERYGPRLIDLDILFFNKQMIDLPGLHIPHPRMAERRFVLQPLSEIAAGFVHPVLHKTVQQLLEECTDPLAVNKIS